MKALIVSLAWLLCSGLAHAAEVKYYDVPKGAHPHDVAPDPRPNGPVWYTAQHQGALGRLDPRSGKVEQIALGDGFEERPEPLSEVASGSCSSLASAAGNALDRTETPAC